MTNKKYIILYYLSFIITLSFMVFSSYKYSELVSLGEYSLSEVFFDLKDNILGIINIILVIVFTVLLLKKKKLQKENILFPIAYICFFTIVVVLCYLFNNKVIIPYMHFSYYLFFINVGYFFLNGYSLLTIKYRK